MNGQLVVVVGGNLFSLAAKYLNDATQWIQIAQANGLLDPQLKGVSQLIIPPINPAAGGGVVS